jgi:hypothetical protein
MAVLEALARRSFPRLANGAALKMSIDRRSNPAQLRPFRQTVSQLPQSPAARKF